jgi:hypothetical protein
MRGVAETRGEVFPDHHEGGKVDREIAVIPSLLGPLSHEDSRAEAGLQVADFVVGAIRVDHRRELDALVALLPPNLADGMSTSEYLAGITEREAERRRRRRKGVGE